LVIAPNVMRWFGKLAAIVAHQAWSIVQPGKYEHLCVLPELRLPIRQHHRQQPKHQNEQNVGHNRNIAM